MPIPLLQGTGARIAQRGPNAAQEFLGNEGSSLPFDLRIELLLLGLGALSTGIHPTYPSPIQDQIDILGKAFD